MCPDGGQWRHLPTEREREKKHKTKIFTYFHIYIHIYIFFLTHAVIYLKAGVI